MAGYVDAGAPGPTASGAALKFVKLSGEDVPYRAPPNSRVCDVTPALGKFFPGGSVRLIDEDGKVLYNNDLLPQSGMVQVQVMGISPGAWSVLYFGALEGFDEPMLRKALEDAWPGDYTGVLTGDDEYRLRETMIEEWGDPTREILQQVVLKCCGEWADYWTFGHSACSYGYPYVRPPYVKKAETVDMMINDVKRWQTLLLDLEGEFALLRTRCSGFDLAEHVEFAVASLLRYVPSFNCESKWHVGFEMWYMPFAQLVCWYFSSTGLEESHLSLLDQITNAIQGFRSYTCPRDAARQVVTQVAPSFSCPVKEVDSTNDWLASRRAMLQVPPPAGRAKNCQDSHFHFIETVDARRDAFRAANLRYALEVVRKDAAVQGLPLTISLLVKWNSYLLGGIAKMDEREFGTGFRKHDAYAKHGRERYPLDSNTAAKFMELLEQANSAEPLSLRVARAYLDICFFHPFDDCNSRLARLAFDFLLTREGYTLSNVEPIFMFAKSAKDAEGAKRLVELVEQLLAERSDDWAKPLASWIEQNPHPNPELKVLYRWFGCMRYPEDTPALMAAQPAKDAPSFSCER